MSGRIGVEDQWTLLPDEIRSGEPWSGLIRYHTDLPDQDLDAKHGYYSDPTRPDGLSITVNVHGYTFAGGFGELQSHVLNDIVHDPNQAFNFPPGDLFSIGGPMRESPRLLDSSFISFSWYDQTGAALDSEALPTNFDPFDFGQFDVTGVPTFSPIYIIIQDSGLATPEDLIRYTVAASIESAELRVIPEPETWVLGILTFSTALCSRFRRSFF